MPTYGPIKRRELIQCLHQLGFAGPFSGGKHQFMIRGDVTIRIPNPHQRDIGKELLGRILRQAGVTKDEWEAI